MEALSLRLCGMWHRVAET